MRYYRVLSINYNNTISILTAYMTYRKCKMWVRNRGNHSFFVISSIKNDQKLAERYLK